MSRRWLLPVALGVLLLGGVPALADADGSTEVRTVERQCSLGGDNQHSAPGPNDCKSADGSFDGSKTYLAQHYSNDVDCGETGPTAHNPTGVRLYGAGDPALQSGRVGTCSDGDGANPAPVQGRAGVAAGTASGVKITVDGDKDNAAPNGNETARGWATVQVGPAPGAPVVTCGDEHSQGGRADSDAPQAGRDKQEECQG